jgi:hypothetical protein
MYSGESSTVCTCWVQRNKHSSDVVYSHYFSGPFARYMNRIIPLFLLLLFSASAYAQSACTPTLEYIVNTKSGLKMREGPGIKFKVVTYVPAKSKLLVCRQLSTPATFEGIAGNWRRVQYKNNFGYMFDGFLAAVAPVAPVPANTDVDRFNMTQLTTLNTVLANDSSKVDSALNYLDQVARTLGYEGLVGPAKPDIDSLFIRKVPTERKTESVAAAVLAEVDLLTETSNYCGDIRDIDPGKIWYAVHRNNSNFEISRAEIQVVKSKYSLSDQLEFDIVAEGKQEIAFLISSEKRLDTNWRVEIPVDFFIRQPKRLFPGQQVELYAYQPVPDIHNTIVFATGAAVDVGQCPVLENYKIKVTGEMGDRLITQDLTPDFSYMGQCGQPEIYWFGDLNRDLYPDIVFVSMGDEGTLFTLFLSDESNPTVLYRKADEWFNISCKE